MKTRQAVPINYGIPSNRASNDDDDEDEDDDEVMIQKYSVNRLNRQKKLFLSPLAPCPSPLASRPPIWQYGLWSFQTWGTKLEIFLPKNQHTQRK